jgi:ATP-binding cassette subfamily C exporter for protease/lipase
MNRKPPSELGVALAELRPYFVRVTGFSVIATLLSLAPSGYMLNVYGRVVDSRSFMTLGMLTLLVLGVYLLMEILEFERSELMGKAGLALDAKMSPRIFAAIFEANLKRLAGGSLQPLNDFRTVREFLYSPVLLAVMEAPVALLFLLLIFAASPVLGWAAVAGALVQTFIGWLNERSTQPPLSMANRVAIDAQQYADGTLRNAQVIESMGMVHHIHKRWMAKQRLFLKLQAAASKRAGGYQAIGKFIATTTSSLMLGLGAWLVLRNELNGGAVMMIVSSILAGRALQPLVQVVQQWRGIVGVRDAWERLDQLLSVVPAKQPGMPLPDPRGRLQVEGLMVAAPGSQIPILRGVAFSVSPGEVVAVVGPSASGKTTLARVLVGLWPSVAGKVRLDGADVYIWDKSGLGPNLGYLPQGVELFDGTLAENIARFGEVEPAKVEAAARLVGVHDFIMSLPLAYDSPVGRDGAMLSGGQRQRVALARALYGDPVFVVLDEPNSSLDEVGDAALASAILELKRRGTTFIVMTHRTSILGVADKMLLLKEGQVQAFGPRDEVLAALAKAAAQTQQAAARQPAHPSVALPA